MNGEQRAYLVRWEMEVWADTPTEAARTARDVQMDPYAEINTFTVALSADVPVDFDPLFVEVEVAPDWLNGSAGSGLGR